MASPSLKQCIKSDEITIMVGAHNGLTAKLGEEAGFDAIWASGFEIASSLGYPDSNIVASSEIVRVCANITKSVSAPVLVDMDSGYGSYTQTYYYIRELARAGVQGVCIEDKLFPKNNSYSQRSQSLEPVADACAKIKASLFGRPSEEFCVIARTEALVAGEGLEQALARATAYSEVGADAIVVQSKCSDPGEIQGFCSQWSEAVPVIAIPTS
jgi:phosphoenolpyruvate phosphomutase